MNPLIGITCSHDWTEPQRFFVNTAYVQAVAAAGGIPILVPYQEEAGLEHILSRIDVLLVTGGVDLVANYFDQALHPKSGIIDPWRDQLDLFMIRGALARQLPILAICRGCQVLRCDLRRQPDPGYREPLPKSAQAPAGSAQVVSHPSCRCRPRQLAGGYLRDCLSLGQFIPPSGVGSDRSRIPGYSVSS